MNEISRKEFLKGVGKTVAGVTMVGTIGAILSGCETTATSAPAESPKAPQWPFTYKKADLEKAMDRAFKAYKEKGG